MAEESNVSLPSTPEATQAVVPTRDVPLAEGFPDGLDRKPRHVTDLFTLGERHLRAGEVRPQERKPDEPLYRPLKIFALDPAASVLEGSVALVNVPYEPLAPGPSGAIFDVRELPQETFTSRGKQVEASKLRVDLGDPSILIRNGLDPSPADWRFHQQMVYTVASSVYAAFRVALGRHVAWGFEDKWSQRADQKDWRLRIYPHDKALGKNAFYDPTSGELRFGWYEGSKRQVVGRNLPDGIYYTCLSHDVIAHEVSHALLDGLRARFLYPSGLDVLAFHEAFGDLVAIFQHFTYDKVLRSAINKSRAELRSAKLLTDIATQFGQTTGKGQALRSAVDVPDEGGLPRPYGKDREPHKLGSVLVSAIFEAFTTVFERKTERYVRLATNGTGVLPEGHLPTDLVNVLAEQASKIASHFLSICIRAVDYCPPVDVRFGEYLRALITADRDLVPDDEWGYREALIDSFRRRAMFPKDVNHLSEDALTWEPPAAPILIRELNFGKLRFQGDPQNPANRRELKR